MPNKKKKKFIDKKNSLTFRLIHRSQQDPIQASEEANKHVLQPVADKDSHKKLKEEQEKYGIYFDDDYNYFQHLRDVNEVCEWEQVDRFHVGRGEKNSENAAAVAGIFDAKPSEEGENIGARPKIQLPSSVFASEVETTVGLLNKAAPDPGPKLNWDPEVMAALDDDFDFDDPDNELEDDFMAVANAPAEEEEDDRVFGLQDCKEEMESESDDAGSNSAEIDSDGDFDFGSEDADDDEVEFGFGEESVGTKMSAASVPRNKNLQLLDAMFEALVEREYKSEDIGALDHLEIGPKGSAEYHEALLQKWAKDYKEKKDKENITMAEFFEQNKAEISEDIRAKYRYGSEDKWVTVYRTEEPKYDIQSIRSTSTRHSNLGGYLDVPKKPKKIKSDSSDMSTEDLPKTEGKKPSNEEDLISKRADRPSTYRPKDETPDEKRARKQAIKEYRKQRLTEKKQTGRMYKEEKLRQDKQLADTRNRVQGMKLV